MIVCNTSQVNYAIETVDLSWSTKNCKFISFPHIVYPIFYGESIRLLQQMLLLFFSYKIYHLPTKKIDFYLLIIVVVAIWCYKLVAMVSWMIFTLNTSFNHLFLFVWSIFRDRFQFALQLTHIQIEIFIECWALEQLNRFDCTMCQLAR